MSDWKDDPSNDGEITANERGEIDRLTAIAEAEGKTVYGASVHKETREIRLHTNLEDPMMLMHPGMKDGDKDELFESLMGLLEGLLTKSNKGLEGALKEAKEKCKECDKTECGNHPDYTGKDDDDLKSSDLGSHVGPKLWS